MNAQDSAPEVIEDVSVSTPVEPTAQAINSAADKPAVSGDVADAKGDADVADANNVETQTTKSLDESRRADEAQQKINEDLERQ